MVLEGVDDGDVLDGVVVWAKAIVDPNNAKPNRFNFNGFIIFYVC